MYFKIRRRDGVEFLTILEEGEFKVPIDGCISHGHNTVYLLENFVGITILNDVLLSSTHQV